MANTLRFKRGLASGLPTGLAGEPLFTTDTFDLYIGNGTGNTRFQKFIASGTTSQLLRGDGSLLTMPIVLSSPANGEVLKYNGTNWVNSSDAGITGSGTTNYLPKFTGAGTLGNSLLQEGSNAIGLGVTPSAWGSNLKAIQLNAFASVFGSTGNFSGIAINMYSDNTNNRYIGTGASALYQQGNGIHYWYTAPSGTAGNVITFSERMQLDINGNLGLGVTPSSVFHIQRNQNATTQIDIQNTTSGTASVSRINLGSDATAGFGNLSKYSNAITAYKIFSGSDFALYNGTAGNISILNDFTSGVIMFAAGGSSTAQMTLTSTGRLLLGSTSDNGLRFQVTGDGYFSGGVRMLRALTINGASIPTDRMLEVTGTTFVTGATNYGIVNNPTYATPTTIYGYYSGIVTTSATNAYGVYLEGPTGTITNYYSLHSNVNSGTGRWNLYMNGSAANYLAGNLGIGSPITNFKLSTFNAGSYTIGLLNSSIGTPGEFVGITYGFGASTYNKGAMYFISRDANGRGDFHFALNNVASAANVSTSDARMILTYEGNLGLGVTPSAWSITPALQVVRASIYNQGDDGTYITSNGYYNASWKYISNSTATQYQMLSGQHRWFTAPSGSANANITFTQAMTLDASGDLQLGTTSSTFNNKLTVVGTSGGDAYITVGDGTRTGLIGTDGTGIQIGAFSNNYLEFRTNNTDRARIYTDGNFGIGTGSTNAGYKLDVNGTMRVSGASTFGGNLGVTLSQNSTTWIAVSNPDTDTTTFGTQAGFRVFVAGLHIGSLKATSRNLTGLSRRSLYLTTEGLYDLAFGVNQSATPSFVIDGSTGAATFSSSVTAGGFITTNSSTVTSPIDTLSTKAYFNASSISGAALTLVADSLGRTFRISSNTSGTVIGAFDASPSSVIIGTNTVHPFVFNIAASERMRLDASGNLGIGMTPSYKLDVTGSARISDAIAIGTTPDTNLPFKILKNINSTVGIRFENTSTGASSFTGYQFGTDVSGGTAFTNFLYASSGVAETGVYKPNGTALINTGSGGLNFLAVSQPIRFFTSTGNGTLRAAITNDGDFTQYNGTNPSASTTDAFRMYSADITAGNAAPHFRTENGGIIKLYQQTTGVTSATYIGGAGTTVTDLDTFDGYTIPQIVKALRNAGLLA